MLVPWIVAGALATVATLAIRLAARRAPAPTWARQLLVGAIALASVGAFAAWSIPRYGPEATGPWEVGELRADGLRIVPTPPGDARDVLGPDVLGHEGHRERYAVARRIPGILNQLYCWCGCVKQGRHRSALACYEDASAQNCAVCQGTARVAWKEVRRGVTDPARVQRAVDRAWGPTGSAAR